MRIAFTADWHIRGKDLDACHTQLCQFAGEVARKCADTVVIAGDIFDNPNIGDQHASMGAQVKVADKIITALTKSVEEIIIIRGNHDQSGPGSADALHVFDPFVFADNPKVTIVRSRAALNRVEVYLACLPWQWDVGQGAAYEIDGLIRHCQVESPNRPIILTGHVRVGSAKMSAKQICAQKQGDWSVDREILSAWPFNHVALGDFHARQDLTGGRGGYVGALRQCNFGEEGNPAGFEIYDTQTRETEWVTLDAAPIHRTILIQPGESADKLKPGENEKLRVQFMGGQIDRVTVKALEENGVSVEHFIEPEERICRADVPSGILQDRHALMRLWAEQQNPPIAEERLARMFDLYGRIFGDTNITETEKKS